MAGSKNTIKRVQSEISANKEKNAQYREEIALLKERIKLGDKLDEQTKEHLKTMEESVKKEKKQVEYVKEYNKALKETASNLGDIDDLHNDITKAYGKNSDLAKQQTRELLQAKAVQSSIVAIMETNTDLTDKQRKKLADVSAAYGNMHTSILAADKSLASGEVNLHKRNELVQEAAKKFVEMGGDISNMTGLTAAQKDEMIKLVEQAKALEKGMQSAAVKHELVQHITEEMTSELGPIGPILGNINKVLNTNVRDTLAWKAAVFALGAALGKAAFDYFGAPIKAGLQAEKERHQAEIDHLAATAKIKKDAEFIPAQISQERLEHEVQANNQINELMHEAAFAAQKAGNAFAASMQQGAAQFERAAKTALFGNKIGGVGYAASQMQLAGIGADKIASAMEAAGAATGKMPTAKMGADMAIMAERTGQSVESVAQLNEYFQRTDGVTANVAMNLQEGMRNMADQAGIGLGNLMKEVAEASKDALSYNIKSGPALAKQVAYAQSLGVSFGDVAKAGKSMVMNYKDSIKAEMQLSSLLGEQVDLSEVRQKFAEGDTEGALKSLQSQGLNPEDMDMFQQDALSQALGGMDISSISKIGKNQGANVGGLAQGAAGAGNQDFLKRTQSAESTLNAKQASISANQAVVDAKLSKEIADSYLASPEYEKYKQAQAQAALEAEELAHKMKDAWLASDDYTKSLSDSAKLNFVDSIKEGLMGGLATIGGGLMTTAIDKLIPKGGKLGKVAGMFGLGGGGGEEGGGEGGGAEAEAGAGGGGPISSVAEEIKAAEPILKEAKPLGQGLREFGQSLGSFIKSVGAGVGKFISTIFQGIATGLTFFANPAVAIGAAGLAASIAVIGAGLAAASWIMGKALPTLAEGLMSFNDVDGGNLAKVGLGITALGVGMAAMGVGSVIAGIGNLVGSLFGGGIEDTVKKVEIFAQANIDAEKVKNNADAIVAYSKAMAASGLGSAASGLGNLVGGIANGIAKFFGAKPPLEQMKEFAKLDMGDTTKLQANAEAFTMFGNAMASYKGSSGSLGGVLADGLAKFFKIEPPIEQMKKFATADFGDTTKLKANADAFTMFGNAMASYKGSSGGLMEVLAEGVSSFMKVESPLDKFQRFAAMDGIDVEKTKNNAEAFTAFGNAMASYKGTDEGFWSSLGEGISSFFGGGKEDLITKFQRFAALDAGGVTAISNAIGSLNSNLANFSSDTANLVATGFSTVATSVTDNLTAERTNAVYSFSSAMASLNSNLAGLNGVGPLLDTASAAFINLASALDRLAEVNVKAVNDLPWIRMTAFASAGGKIVLAQSANNSFNIAQDTAKNIDKMNTAVQSNLQVSKNLQALIAVLAHEEGAGTQLIIDGKAVANMLTRRDDNRKATKPSP